MLLINFGHPFAPGVQEHLESGIEESLTVKTVKVQLDNDRSFAEQIVLILDSVGITPQDWQTERFVVVLPGLAPAAACVLAEIHGRCGYWPTVLRLKPVPNTTPPQFVFGELINLMVLRNVSRERR